MWYYVIGALIFSKLNGIVSIVDETASLVKNGYSLYQWYTCPKIPQIANEVCILELQNSSTQTREDDECDTDDDVSSPEIILFQHPYRSYVK